MRACAAYRVGFTFYRGDAELNRAVTECSTHGRALIDAASTCSGLEKSLPFQFQDDGLAELMEAKKRALACATTR